MKIKSLENFKSNEYFLNTGLVLGGRPVNSGAGSRPSPMCGSGMCYSADYTDEDGDTTYYDIYDCDTEPAAGAKY